MPSATSATPTGLPALDTPSLTKFLRALEEHAPEPAVTIGQLATTEGCLRIAFDKGKASIAADIRGILKGREGRQ